MYEGLPNGIKNEKDLEIFKIFLKNTDKLYNSKFDNRLLENKGKFIKIKTMECGRIITRCGYLMDVGTDFIVIKHPSQNCHFAVRIANIKCLAL